MENREIRKNTWGIRGEYAQNTGEYAENTLRTRTLMHQMRFNSQRAISCIDCIRGYHPLPLPPSRIRREYVQNTRKYIRNTRIIVKLWTRSVPTLQNRVNKTVPLMNIARSKEYVGKYAQNTWGSSRLAASNGRSQICILRRWSLESSG